MKTHSHVLIIAVVLMLMLVFSTFQFGKMYFNELHEKNRLEHSFSAAYKETEYYKALNGSLAAKNDVLQLKNGELKDIYPSIIAEIRNLKVGLGHVSRFSETAIHGQKDVITTLRDSIVFDTVPIKTFTYRDAFYSVNGFVLQNTEHIHIESRDSIIQVVFKGKRYKPGWWFFSRRKLQQVISCKNPNDSIEYTRVIEVEK